MRSDLAFGGIVALNRRLDAAAATEILKVFTEVVIAPDADDAAVKLFAAKKNVRLLLTGVLPDPRKQGGVFRSVAGGFLMQTRDVSHITAGDLKIVTGASRPWRRSRTCCSPSPSAST